MYPQRISAELAAHPVLQRLAGELAGTPFQGKVYAVGGLLRDAWLGLPRPQDLDLVVDGDALELAHLLFNQGCSTHYPVTYPRFGTAMMHVPVKGEVPVPVELVSARAESYQERSRKPQVKRASLQADALRRDFTINTLMWSLSTHEILDLTGWGRKDLEAGILRTPLDPAVTFHDDPLRMLRAVRFAAALGFRVESEAWRSICEEAGRLVSSAISAERIRDEFSRIVKLPGRRARAGMQLLLESGLLARFLPEMLDMVGCEQGSWHPFDVWTHTLVALECLPDRAALTTRLALLWHDVGKPSTRTAVPAPDKPDRDASGAPPPGVEVRFFGHAEVGARIAGTLMRRLRYAAEETRTVTTLVEQHMRLGQYRRDWSDAAVKRLIRQCGGFLDELFLLTECDRSAVRIPADAAADLADLRRRIDELNRGSSVLAIRSPLDGRQIMEALGTGQGPHIRDAKEFLTDEVIEGRLREEDAAAAVQALRAWWSERTTK